MCSSGLEALTFPFSTKFLRSTNLRFTISPAIATYTLLGHRASSSSVGLSVGLGMRWDGHTLQPSLGLSVGWCGLANAKGRDKLCVAVERWHSYSFKVFSNVVLNSFSLL